MKENILKRIITEGYCVYCSKNYSGSANDFGILVIDIVPATSIAANRNIEPIFVLLFIVI